MPAVAFDETPSFFALTVPVTVDAAAVAGADTMRTPWASWAKRSFAACWVDAADAAEASTAEATNADTTRRSMRMRAYLLVRGRSGGVTPCQGPPRRATPTPRFATAETSGCWPVDYPSSAAALGGGPTYFAEGLISRASRFCSRMCADQPATRAQVNMLVKRSGGTSARSSTTADQNSTLVARTRSGLRACSSASAARSSASATSKRVEPSSRAVRRRTRAARVLGAIDAVAEAHEALAAIQRVA